MVIFVQLISTVPRNMFAVALVMRMVKNITCPKKALRLRNFLFLIYLAINIYTISLAISFAGENRTVYIG